MAHDVYFFIFPPASKECEAVPLLGELLRRSDAMSVTLDRMKTEIQAQAQALADTQTAIITEGEQVAAQIQALKDQIAAGGSPTEAELGAVLESMQRVTAAAQAAKTAVEAIFTPDPVPPPVEPAV